jgi:hypothetical protein
VKDISYHILDIVRNSLNAGARMVEIHILEYSQTGQLVLKIKDNGSGMKEEMINKVTDPFFTTSVKKKVGLGLPLLKQNAELTGGRFSIESAVQKGTLVEAVFNLHHIDMIPIGDLALTFRTLIASSPDTDFLYRYRVDDCGFDLDTAEIRMRLEGVSLNTREVLDYVTDAIHANLKALKGWK